MKIDWEKVRLAAEAVEKNMGGKNKLGPDTGVTVYNCGPNVIRIDIKV